MINIKGLGQKSLDCLFQICAPVPECSTQGVQAQQKTTTNKKTKKKAKAFTMHTESKKCSARKDDDTFVQPFTHKTIRVVDSHHGEQKVGNKVLQPIAQTYHISATVCTHRT